MGGAVFAAHLKRKLIQKLIYVNFCVVSGTDLRIYRLFVRMLSLVNDLVKMLSLFYPVPKEVKSYLLAHCRIRKAAKGEYLLVPGAICDRYFFIHEGVVRAFIREGNKEVTTWISSANEIATSIYSMQENRPSMEYIQAIRESTLLELDAEKLEELFKKIPETNIIIRRLLTAYYQDAEIRSFIARIPSAEARCQFFLKTYPEKALLVPKKYIASFLGIREETLSRVLKKRG